MEIMRSADLVPLDALSDGLLAMHETDCRNERACISVLLARRTRNVDPSLRTHTH